MPVNLNIYRSIFLTTRYKRFGELRVMVTALLVLFYSSAFAQKQQENLPSDLAVQLLKSSRKDSNIVLSISDISDYYIPSNTLLKKKRNSSSLNLNDYHSSIEKDTATLLVQKGFAIAREINYQKGEAIL